MNIDKIEQSSFNKCNTELPVWQNKDYSFGLGLENVTSNMKRIEALMDFTSKFTENIKETTFLNENKDRIWIWNNLGIIISIGLVFEKEDDEILKHILDYFDQTQSCFLPCDLKLLNYKNEVVKTIESQFGIDNGNYHFILIPFVLNDKENILKHAPEKQFSKFGPTFVYQSPESIVEYMIDLYSKYAAVNNSLLPGSGNYLHLGENLTDSSKRDHSDHGITRTMNPTTFNWQQHGGNTKRVHRKGYIDPNASDWYELINPEQDYSKIAPSKYWGDDEEQLDQNTTYRRNLSSNYHRENPGVNMGWFNKEGYSQNQNHYKSKIKNSLYNQLYQDQIKNVGVNETKGVHLKMNDYYETSYNKEEKPNYIIYEHSDMLRNGNPDKFMDVVIDRDSMPAGWGEQTSFRLEIPKSQMETTIDGIIGTSQKLKILSRLD